MNPLVFKRMIRRADPKAQPGDVVTVYDKAGKYFGRALYSPHSQIALRMLTYENKPIDDTFWSAYLQQAVDLRRRLRLDEITDAYRLVHAEGDGLSGLILERYADCLVCEVFTISMYQRARLFADLIGPMLGPPTIADRPGTSGDKWRLIIRADAHIERIEGFAVTPEERSLGGTLVIREHGIRYQVDVSAGHKTGFFCDQRDNRRRFAALCKDATVLDLCCYTGGFGLSAKLLGPAREVTSVDLDENALAIAKTNVNLNSTRVNMIHSDAFIYLRQMMTNARKFDCVVCDPPKFAPTRDDVDDALRKYHDLNCLAMQVVRPGGIFLTCSCSGLVSREMFTDAIVRAARRCGRDLQIFDQTGAAPDHPVMINCPESEYLKALWCRVL